MKGKTVLITDGGGRGAALVDKYAKSKHVAKIIAVPGNELMQINSKKPVKIYPHLKTTSIKEILEICQKEKVDLVDVAQDNAVESGLVNALNKLNITAFGPTKEAGQIEWDKAWSRDFMKKYQIPHPEYHVFSSEEDGIEFVKNRSNTGWFVKAAGLAEGKGVIPAQNINETVTAIKSLKKFGKAGKTYLLEQCLIGEEFSAFALLDGKTFQIIGFAQDHKRVKDGDKGPNTGGMGCVSNPKIIDKKIRKQIEEIFKKTVKGLKKEKRVYKGVLYLGGIVVEDKSLTAGREVYVIEFNARWGDPEAEVILPSIKNDLYEVAETIISGRIKNLKILTDKKVRVCIAACSKGYPIDHSNVLGKKVLGIEKARATGVKIYGAGIKKEDKHYVVNGGRILYLIAEGKDVITARKQAYNAMQLINIEDNNLHYRTDIGWRDVERLSAQNY